MTLSTEMALQLDSQRSFLLGNSLHIEICSPKRCRGSSKENPDLPAKWGSETRTGKMNLISHGSSGKNQTPLFSSLIIGQDLHPLLKVPITLLPFITVYVKETWTIVLPRLKLLLNTSVRSAEPLLIKILSSLYDITSLSRNSQCAERQ